MVRIYEEPALSKRLVIQETKKEHEGDITLITFPLLKISKKILFKPLKRLEKS